MTISIQNITTGDSFNTEVSMLSKADFKILNNSNWIFDWHKEFENRSKQIYKLTIANNPKIIQGLISIEGRKDHVLCI